MSASQMNKTCKGRLEGARKLLEFIPSPPDPQIASLPTFSAPFLRNWRHLVGPRNAPFPVRRRTLPAVPFACTVKEKRATWQTENAQKGGKRTDRQKGLKGRKAERQEGRKVERQKGRNGGWVRGERGGRLPYPKLPPPWPWLPAPPAHLPLLTRSPPVGPHSLGGCQPPGRTVAGENNREGQVSGEHNTRQLLS